MACKSAEIRCSFEDRQPQPRLLRLELNYVIRFINLFILIIFGGTDLVAAQPRISDLVGFGYSAIINATIVDPAGNIYVTGEVSGEFKTFPGVVRIRPPSSSRDVFVAKFTPFGAILFGAVIGGAS